MANSNSWEKIFEDYNILSHNFDKSPFEITSEMIKKSCQDFEKTGEKEVRILCKQDSREDRPDIMIEHGLFLLPIKNGTYIILKGEGYTDIPDITLESETYISKLSFTPDSVKVGNSEMQHLDYAYACSIVRTFMDDEDLMLTIRGRKYTPQFSFNIKNHKIMVESVQTEVDAGYESKDKIVLIEAKNSHTKNVINSINE